MTRRIMTVVVAVAVLAWSGCKEDPAPECGNNDKEGDEVCDGTDTGSENCQTQGYLGGTLRCAADCMSFVTTSCTGACGNNMAEGAEEGVDPPELCDGTDLRGENCQTQGYDLGTLACNSTCDGYDMGDCRDAECGDGTVEAWEECEPGGETDMTCRYFEYEEGDMYDEGDLACHAAGTAEECHWDLSGCIAWICGNGVIEGYESCDDTNLGDPPMTCEDLLYDGGDLACLPSGDENECDWDESGCVDYVCGDGDVQPTEDCEPGVAITELCSDNGFESGDLGCIAAGDPDECMFDYSACVNGCGNDTVETDEVCDGTDLGGETCESQGFVGGSLHCQPDCSDFDTTGCISA